MLLALPFLIFVGLVLPLAAVFSARSARGVSTSSDALPSANALALSAIVAQAVTGLLAWLALANAPIVVSLAGRLEPVPLAATLAFVASFLALARLEARRPLDPTDRVRQLLRGIGVTPAWFATFVVAAFVEEFAYRGVLTALLETWMPHVGAALTSAVLFGLAHASQGVRGFLLSTMFAIGAQALADHTGGLLLPMLAHLVYDVGVAWLGKRLSATSDAT